jgi:hypothetical protein
MSDDVATLLRMPDNDTMPNVVMVALGRSA